MIKGFKIGASVNYAICINFFLSFLIFGHGIAKIL